MAATKRRLRKSVDAVLFRNEFGRSYGLFFPRKPTTIEELWESCDEDSIPTPEYTDITLCDYDFEKIFGKMGLRLGRGSKVRITIERIK